MVVRELYQCRRVPNKGAYDSYDIITKPLTFERNDVRRFGQRQHHVHPKQQVRVQHVHGGAGDRDDRARKDFRGFGVRNARGGRRKNPVRPGDDRRPRASSTCVFIVMLLRR